MSGYEFVGGWKQDVHPEKELTHWETFRNHREIITNFIRRQSPAFAKSLCVLGAGLCHDIELNELKPCFEAINLVDIAELDVQAGVKNQRLTDDSSIEIIQRDVTGIHDLLLDFKSNPSDESMDRIFETCTGFELQGLRRHDCVASTCLLSQLLCHVTECVGEEHPRFVELIQTVRSRHIENMINLLNPGGVGFLFTDFVSSESLPDLYSTTELKVTVKQAIAARNFLHGLNPGMVLQSFDQHSIRSHLGSIKLTDPWRWVLPTRIYACVAIIFDKLN